MNIIDEFRQRGILYDVTNEQKILSLKGRGVYIGFDPTATSLHLGNYMQIVSLLRFKKAGYKIYAVLGGATAMIGDPSGKNSERNLLSEKEIHINKSSIAKQLSSFNIKVIDNYIFYKDINVLDFLRDTGKLLNVNYMINKDIIKNRLNEGISFAEFSYQLIQGWDFYKLYQDYDVAVQIGGSDQWGNITSGLEIIRKKIKDNPIAAGLTTKLLIKSDGTKFGKTSDGNETIWLDSQLTSTFKIYQYLLNQPDLDIKNLLNWLTFLSINDIKNIMIKHHESPNLKLAQNTLANEIVKDLRGMDELNSAIASTNILFSKNNNSEINDQNLAYLMNDIPHIKISKINIVDAIIKSKLAVSKREAKEFILNGAISLNGVMNNDLTHIIIPKGNNKKFTLIKRGKRNNALIIFQ